MARAAQGGGRAENPDTAAVVPAIRGSSAQPPRAARFPAPTGINLARLTAACSLVVLDLRPRVFKCVLSTFGDPSLVLCKQDSVYTFACNVFIGFPESGFCPTVLIMKGMFIHLKMYWACAMSRALCYALGTQSLASQGSHEKDKQVITIRGDKYRGKATHRRLCKHRGHPHQPRKLGRGVWAGSGGV